jgi:hypothetical protein
MATHPSGSLSTARLSPAKAEDPSSIAPGSSFSHSSTSTRSVAKTGRTPPGSTPARCSFTVRGLSALDFGDLRGRRTEEPTRVMAARSARRARNTASGGVNSPSSSTEPTRMRQSGSGEGELPHAGTPSLSAAAVSAHGALPMRRRPPSSRRWGTQACASSPPGARECLPTERVGAPPGPKNAPSAALHWASPNSQSTNAWESIAEGQAKGGLAERPTHCGERSNAFLPAAPETLRPSPFRRPSRSSSSAHSQNAALKWRRERSVPREARLSFERWVWLTSRARKLGRPLTKQATISSSR